MSHSSQKAFTLYELLIVISIAALLMSFSIPSFKNIVLSRRYETLQMQLEDIIQLARETAANEDSIVILCNTHDNRTCETNAHGKLILFFDEYHDGMIHSKHQLILTINSFAPGRLFLRSYPYYQNYIKFSGEVLNVDNATFWFCNEGKSIWGVGVNKKGSVRKFYPDKGGVLHDSHNSKLICG